MASTRPHQDQGMKCGGHRTTQSRLTFSRKRLVDVGQETMNIGERGWYINRRGRKVDISEALDKAKSESEHYHFDHTFEPPSKKLLGSHTTKFTIAYGSPLQLASKLQQHVATDGGQVAVLNSASSKNPGGRVLKGTLSQEDQICRASLLYPCLFQYFGVRGKYYDINLSPPYNGTTSSACAIFSPRVPVIREDSVESPLLDDPEYISFVSIPATNAFTHGKLPDEDACPEEEYEKRRKILKADMRDRIYRALSIMASHNCTDIVLSAFGCGVHGNDPYMVSSIFKELLEKDFGGVFHRVIFAIQPSRRTNYQAFTKHFGVTE